MMLSVPLSLSATEQSIVIWSVVSRTTLFPAISSNELPTGMGASFIIMLVPLVTLFEPPLLPVSLTNLTVAVTCEVCMLLSIKPRTTVVVLPAAVYITYGVPLLAGSAAKVITLNVFAILLPQCDC